MSEWPIVHEWSVDGQRRQGRASDPVAWKTPDRSYDGGRYRDPDKPLASWQRIVHLMSKSHAPREPYEGPVQVECLFRIPIPPSYKKWRREFLPGKPVPKRPDVDNYVKAVVDALQRNKLFMVDDGQVHSEKGAKKYVADHCAPGVDILLRAFPPLPGRKKDLDESWWS